MRSLNGRELAGYIKERQAKQVRSLRQAQGIAPKLAIVVTDVDNPVIEVYMRLKTKYGADILIDVDVHKVPQTEVRELLNVLSNDDSVHGIIVQLPLADVSETEEVVQLVDPAKDVDGLVAHSEFEPATALAIMWLLAGYNIDMAGKNVLLVGHGKLVGQPLEQLMLASGITGKFDTMFWQSCFAKYGAREQPFVPIPFKIPTVGNLGWKPTNGLRSNVAGRMPAMWSTILYEDFTVCFSQLVPNWRKPGVGLSSSNSHR